MASARTYLAQENGVDLRVVLELRENAHALDLARRAVDVELSQSLRICLREVSITTVMSGEATHLQRVHIVGEREQKSDCTCRSIVTFGFRQQN